MWVLANVMDNYAKAMKRRKLISRPPSKWKESDRAFAASVQEDFVDLEILLETKFGRRKFNWEYWQRSYNHYGILQFIYACISLKYDVGPFNKCFFNLLYNEFQTAYNSAGDMKIIKALCLFTLIKVLIATPAINQHNFLWGETYVSSYVLRTEMFEKLKELYDAEKELANDTKPRPPKVKPKKLKPKKIAKKRKAPSEAELENVDVQETSNDPSMVKKQKKELVESKSTTESDLDDLSPECYCPISMGVMKDPVVAADGHSYEKTEILEWFRVGNGTSPKTGLPLDSFDIVPNLSLKTIIQDQIEKQKNERLAREKKPELEGSENTARKNTLFSYQRHIESNSKGKKEDPKVEVASVSVVVNDKKGAEKEVKKKRKR